MAAVAGTDGGCFLLLRAFGADRLSSSSSSSRRLAVASSPSPRSGRQLGPCYCTPTDCPTRRTLSGPPASQKRGFSGRKFLCQSGSILRLSFRARQCWLLRSLRPLSQVVSEISRQASEEVRRPSRNFSLSCSIAVKAEKSKTVKAIVC